MDAMMGRLPRFWSALDVVGDAKTADGWTAAARRCLVRAIALGAVCLIARVGVAATESDFADALYAPLFALSLIYALLSPAVYAMIFRLRARRGLRSAVVSAALYAPIFSLATSAAIAISLSPTLSPFADGGGRASDVAFGNWTAFALTMGVAASALTALAHRMGKAPAPPPGHNRKPTLRADRGGGFYRRARLRPDTSAFGGLGRAKPRMRASPPS